MKKIILFLFLSLTIFSLSGINYCFAFSTNNHSSIVAPAPKYLQASEFVKLSPKEFSAITGKKLNFFQRIEFNLLKAKMRHDLKKNPDLKITEYFPKNNPLPPFKINWLWLLLGLAGPIVAAFSGAGLALFLLISITPVVGAYITKHDRNKLKSTYLGFGIALLLLIILVLIFSPGGFI